MLGGTFVLVAIQVSLADLIFSKRDRVKVHLFS
jgi:hypothetical protein